MLKLVGLKIQIYINDWLVIAHSRDKKQFYFVPGTGIGFYISALLEMRGILFPQDPSWKSLEIRKYRCITDWISSHPVGQDCEQVFMLLRYV